MRPQLFDECIPYLLERFPYIFEKRGDAIYNKALDETVPLGRDKTLEDPLIRLSRLTQEGAQQSPHVSQSLLNRRF